MKRGDTGLKHLALFSTAFDTMLRSPDLLGLTVKDVRKRNGVMRDSTAGCPSAVHAVKDHDEGTGEVDPRNR